MPPTTKIIVYDTNEDQWIELEADQEELDEMDRIQNEYEAQLEIRRKENRRLEHEAMKYERQ